MLLGTMLISGFSKSCTSNRYGVLFTLQGKIYFPAEEEGIKGIAYYTRFFLSFRLIYHLSCLVTGEKVELYKWKESVSLERKRGKGYLLPRTGQRVIVEKSHLGMYFCF